MVLIAIIGCDPGMIIRQRVTDITFPNKDTSKEIPLALHVRETSQLIGETWYVPEVELTNNNVSSISIVRFELLSMNRTYQNKESLHEESSHNLKSGASIIIKPWFDLDEPIYNVFKTGAELKVYYEMNGNRFESSAVIEGVY